MAGGVEQEIHSLRLDIAKMQPLVNEVHENMPRIAVALETLARVTEKLEANTEEHRRIHYRITAEEDARRELGEECADLDKRFEKLREEHIICTTKSRVREKDARYGMLSRIKNGAAEKIGEYLLLGAITLVCWLLYLRFMHGVGVPPFHG